MSRTLYLHLGLPKTGSTYLQTRLFPSLADFRLVCMPPGGQFIDEEDDRLLASIFTRSDTIWKHHADPLFGALLGRGWREDGRDILLSDEAIGRTASRQGLLAAHLAAMKAALARRGIERLKLLCLVRRQDHWLISHYVQISDRRKNPGQADFERLVSGTGDPRRERFKFGALLDHASTYVALADAVGEENVCMLPMEWLRADQPAIGRGMAEWLDLPPERIELGASKADNVRRSGERSWELRPGPWRRRLGRFSLRRSRQVRLSLELSSEILSLYRGCNEELGKLTGLDLEPLGYFPEVRRDS